MTQVAVSEGVAEWLCSLGIVTRADLVAQAYGQQSLLSAPKSRELHNGQARPRGVSNCREQRRAGQHSPSMPDPLATAYGQLVARRV